MHHINLDLTSQGWRGEASKENKITFLKFSTDMFKKQSVLGLTSSDTFGIYVLDLG